MSLSRRDILIVVFATIAFVAFAESAITALCESRWVTQAEFCNHVDSEMVRDGAIARARSAANEHQSYVDAQQNETMRKFTEEAAAIRTLIESIRADLNKIVPPRQTEEGTPS